MAAKLSSEAWAQIRHDYEDTERLVVDICAEHGISSGTLRDRVRRWGWTRRRLPIPSEGPLRAAPQNGPGPCATMRACDAAASLATAPQIESAAPYYPDVPQVAAGEVAGACSEGGNTAIVPRLQNAVARVLLAIETMAVKLPAEAAHPRELERAARVLAALTRTLRELNGLLGQRQPPTAATESAAETDDDPPPKDMEAFRFELARRINAFVDANKAEPDDDSGPEGV